MSAPLITAVEVSPLRLPPASPWEDATNRVHALEFVVVRVRCANGVSGWGYTYSVDVGGTAIAALITDYLTPLVLGHDIRQVEELWTTMERQTRRLGRGVNRLAMAAIDIAIWDAIGVFYDAPLPDVWGRSRSEISTYRSEIRLDGDIAGLIERTQSYRDEGYIDNKVKVGHPDAATDRSRLRAVRQIMPGQVYADANQKWSVAEAKAVLGGLIDEGIGWIEEPLHYSDVHGHAELRNHFPVAVALGESLFSKEQFVEYLRADAVDIVQADVAFVGGFTEWRRIAALADAFGKPIAPHYMMELSLPALCSAPNALALENVAGGSLYELGLTTEPVRISSGTAQMSGQAGTGVQFDEAALDRYRLDPVVVRQTFAGGSK